jgi:hypothetical protein
VDQGDELSDRSIDGVGLDDEQLEGARAFGFLQSYLRVAQLAWDIIYSSRQRMEEEEERMEHLAAALTNG